MVVFKPSLACSSEWVPPKKKNLPGIKAESLRVDYSLKSLLKPAFHQIIVSGLDINLLLDDTGKITILGEFMAIAAIFSCQLIYIL